MKLLWEAISDAVLYSLMQGIAMSWRRFLSATTSVKKNETKTVLMAGGLPHKEATTDRNSLFLDQKVFRPQFSHALTLFRHVHCHSDTVYLCLPAFNVFITSSTLI
jgi:hypothetical protein